jgi:hypothetical protein
MQQLLPCAQVGWSLQSLYERRWVFELSWKIILLPYVLFSSVCCLPNSPSYSERFELRPSRGQHPWYVPYRDWAGYNNLSVISMESTAYHPSGALNFEVAPRFLEPLWTPAVN